jgi:hypothetical protein
VISGGISVIIFIFGAACACAVFGMGGV